MTPRIERDIGNAAKQAWCLAASSTDATAKQLTSVYGRRWGIECTLRDSKNLRFGMGLGTIRVKSPERRDRLWLINAFAVVLLTLLGAAGEALGYDRMLKTNTAKRRVHSLFRQGCMLYDLIPTMREEWLRPLMQRFSQMLQEQPLFTDVFGPVVGGCTDPRKSGAECLNWWGDNGRREALAERHARDCWIGGGVSS